MYSSHSLHFSVFGWLFLLSLSFSLNSLLVAAEAAHFSRVANQGKGVAVVITGAFCHAGNIPHPSHEGRQAGESPLHLQRSAPAKYMKQNGLMVVGDRIRTSNGYTYELRGSRGFYTLKHTRTHITGNHTYALRCKLM